MFGSTRTLRSHFARNSRWWIIALFAMAAIALYFWMGNQEARKPRDSALSPSANLSDSASAPAVRYPVHANRPSPEQLPSLSESDGVIREAIENLLDQEVCNFCNFDEIVRRFVATVDNLARDDLSPGVMPVKSVPGLIVTTRPGNRVVLSPRNAARYQPYVRLIGALPTGALVSLYVRFYPLLQQQYENLGYPGRYFNDRVVEVIDHLVLTPEVHGPLVLIQPGVLYEFADPELEALSAGQKILVRMGPENAAKVKAKLREIREALTANSAAVRQ